MPITRRQFVKRGAGLVSVGLVMPRIFLGEARGQQAPAASSRKMVIIQLAGGNDGFNTVVPYTDSRYYALRPTLALREMELKTASGSSTIISNEFGLHPAMSHIKGLYDDGKVAIVLGVGYPNPSLSHFLSMDIWHTADLTGLSGRGWLGKYADLALVGKPGLPAAAIGNLELPKSFYADKVVVPNIINFSLYNFIADPAHPGDYNNQINAFNEAASRAFPTDTPLGFINNAAFEAVRGAQQVQESINKYQSSISYPDNNPLAVGLKMVAQLMVALPDINLLYVQMGGFDNHSDQIGDRGSNKSNRLIGDHAALIGWFSQAVKLFYDDMTEHGLADDLLIMQWSEFGRRPGENASFGSDHGTASAQMIIGNAVRGGLYGEQPSLQASDLDTAGNPQFKVDFREVYATVLDRWLSVDSKTVLGASFPNVGFLA